MPTLKWKLKDTKSCEGCPKYMLAHDDEWICLLGFVFEDEDWHEIADYRPQACINELGE